MARKKSVTPVQKSIQSASEEAREQALIEISDLRKDLVALERALKAKKDPPEEFPLLDVVHGAFEIYRQAAEVFRGRQLLSRMEDDFALAIAREKLEKRGATLLTKPEGWHWISPAGEMHFLAPGEEPEKALDKLAALKGGGARPKGKAAPKSKAGKKQPAGKNPAKDEAQSRAAT